MRAAPAVSCARMHKKTHTSIQVQRTQSGFPCAVVYGLFRALPGDRAFLPPSSLRSLLLKNLTPASGRQDHTTLPSASSAFVSRAISVHRIPLPTSVTIAIRPSCGGGTTGRDHNFRFSEREIFLRGELTTPLSLNPLGKLDFTRNEFRARAAGRAAHIQQKMMCLICPSGKFSRGRTQQ